MQEGWAAFMGVIIGSFITSIATIATIAYQHSKLREEHTQDILIQERIEKYKKINSLLFELWWNLPIPLISLKEFNSETTRKQIESIKEYMYHNSLFIEPNVQYTFWKYFGELEKWCQQLRLYSEKEIFSKFPDFEEKLKETLDNLINCTRTAILKDLNVSGFENFSSKEVRSLYRQGIDKINSLLKKRRLS